MAAAAFEEAIRLERSLLTDGGIGPGGDAYRPEEGASAPAAREYHSPQVEALTAAGVDFLFAPTFPDVEEATGAAMAMAASGLPHVVSFVLRTDGRVMDGHSLAVTDPERSTGTWPLALLLIAKEA